MLADLAAEALNCLALVSLQDRIIGTLFGSALGDAIGLYTEFLSSDQAHKEYPSGKFTLLPAEIATPFRRDFHRGPHQTGEWTDDTDQALLILLSFLHSDGQELDPKDFAARLRVWVEMGLRALDTLPLGLGRTVGAIVRSRDFLHDPHGAAYAHWEIGEYSAAPNGSLMRTHPLGLMCVSRPLDYTFAIAASYSVITHVDPRCVVSCMIGTALVRGLVRGEVRTEEDIDILVNLAVYVYLGIHKTFREEGPNKAGEPELNVDELKTYTAATQTLETLELDSPAKIGYVYKCLGSGICILRLAMRKMAETSSTATQLMLFELLITELIMYGGDADTNACFGGALLGAYLGYKALPPHWRDGLRHGTWLLEKSEALCQVLRVMPGTYSGEMDRDTYPDGGRGFLTKDDMERRWLLLQARVATENREYIKREEEAAKKRTKRIIVSRILPWSGR